jgi:acetyl esterase
VQVWRQDVTIMTQRDIDPGMLNFYDALSKQTPPEAVTWPLNRQRKAWEDVCRMFRAPRPAGIAVEDIDVDGVHCRIYCPAANGPKPGLIYFHGGGWVLGSCETHDDICAEMAAGADVAVVMVDYRLAPEHRHPAQLEDSLKVLGWMRRGVPGIDPHNIVAGGDSAGGQMTVGLCLELRSLGEPQPQGQVLIYPGLSVDFDGPSYVRNAEAPCLTRDDMIYYLESFLGPKGNPNWRDPRAVPLLATDLRGLPPAFVSVAAHDPLCDDGIIFAERLNAAGIPVMLREEPKLAHSFMRARHQSAPAMEGFQAIIAALRSLAHSGALPKLP